MFARSKVTHRGGHSAGFTMVELMVTVGIAAILTAVAVPSFNQLIISSRLVTQSNDLVAAINFARSEAIKRNTNISLCRVNAVDSTTCVTGAGAWQNWIVTPGGGNVVRRGVVNTAAGGMNVQSTLTNDALVFGAEGLARSGGVLVTNQRISVCSTRTSTDNIRRVVLGSGSRLSTTTASGACGP
ncbi:GspH/FimT family pseudopilin [Steroidobacter sp.]|uniref:GspH/FimT family pseudopilin n=1 Tax=Steroidobacter sp. TaxID=1978227 RepID=UPI001A4CF791|nr:GspH/FimT family pseudopilin [Steroidobacter sp.]MBL8265214.1 GspH/FimT family pseudopilin [Steroidobacter sp.]